MNNKDKEIIADRYRERLEKFGPGNQALATGNEERRTIRFNGLRSVGDLEGASVLDLGCGLADFYAYLKDLGINVRYTGYDITPAFIAAAQARFPEATFEVRDIQTQGIPEKFDYIISSQTFNNRLEHEDNLQLMQDVLRICLGACNRGVAVDMMTSYVDFRADNLFYYTPEDIFKYAKSLTKRVTLRHDYPLFEFAIFLYPDFTPWRNDRA